MYICIYIPCSNQKCMMYVFMSTQYHYISHSSACCHCLRTEMQWAMVLIIEDDNSLKASFPSIIYKGMSYLLNVLVMSSCSRHQPLYLWNSSVFMYTSSVSPRFVLLCKNNALNVSLFGVQWFPLVTNTVQFVCYIFTFSPYR